MIQYVQIFDADTCVALLVHDHQVGRVVFKGDPFSPLYQGLLPWWDQPVVAYSAHQGAVLRRIILPNDSTYLSALTKKTIHAPYRTGGFLNGPATRLDEAANSLMETLLPKLGSICGFLLATHDSQRDDTMPITQHKIQRYGWKKQQLDHRDRTLCVKRETLQMLPVYTDLTAGFGGVVYDQGALGSCTANSLAHAVEFAQIKAKEAHIWRPSRLDLYYNERVIEGTVAIDAGAELRDGIKVLAGDGVAPEYMWPYDITRFAEVPPPDVVAAARKNLITSYEAVSQTADAMKACLSDGYPFAMGFTVYPDFESPAVAASGKVPLPGKDAQPLGGHAVLCVGYDDNTSMFRCLNSWGDGWGQKGFFEIPYEYLLNQNLASDFWVIKTTEDGS